MVMRVDSCCSMAPVCANADKANSRADFRQLGRGSKPGGLSCQPLADRRRAVLIGVHSKLPDLHGGEFEVVMSRFVAVKVRLWVVGKRVGPGGGCLQAVGRRLQPWQGPVQMPNSDGIPICMRNNYSCFINVKVLRILPFQERCSAQPEPRRGPRIQPSAPSPSPCPDPHARTHPIPCPETPSQPQTDSILANIGATSCSKELQIAPNTARPAQQTAPALPAGLGRACATHPETPPCLSTPAMP